MEDRRNLYLGTGSPQRSSGRAKVMQSRLRLFSKASGNRSIFSILGRGPARRRLIIFFLDSEEGPVFVRSQMKILLSR